MAQQSGSCLLDQNNARSQPDPQAEGNSCLFLLEHLVLRYWSTRNTPVFQHHLTRNTAVFMMGTMYLPRHIDAVLLDWSREADRKPLVLRGARQTGKTAAV